MLPLHRRDGPAPIPGGDSPTGPGTREAPFSCATVTRIGGACMALTLAHTLCSVKNMFSLSVQSIGAEIFHARAALGWSRQQLAVRISGHLDDGDTVHPNTVAAWEDGRHQPQLNMFGALCCALQRTPDQLLRMVALNS